MTIENLQEQNLILKLKIEKTEELLNIYMHDQLTGLKMRRNFDLKFANLFHCGVKFYLTLLDVNGLHKLNRDEGFAAGDALIKRTANTLIEETEGIVYRLGGDEFVALSILKPNHSNNDEYICVYTDNKDFKNEKDMFTALDDMLIQEKENFYKRAEKNRRNTQGETK